MGFGIFDEHKLENYAFSADDSATPGAYELVSIDGYAHRVDVALCTSTDTADQVVEIKLSGSFGPVVMGEVTIPAGAGHGAVPPVDLVLALPLASVGSILVAQNVQLLVNFTTAISSGKTVDVAGMGGAF